MVDSIEWNLEVVSYDNVSLVPNTGKSVKHQLQKIEELIVSVVGGVNNKPNDLKPNQPVSQTARPARNKDGVFTWMIEKVQFCESIFVLCKKKIMNGIIMLIRKFLNCYENTIERTKKKPVTITK